jgi:hypothetical protein
LQDAANQHNLAAQEITRAQKDTANYSSTQQQWMQKTLGAVTQSRL